jgi:predicted RNase H-like HicB family nuclease
MATAGDTRMSSYVALIDGEAGNFGVSFPDLPGCVTVADSEDEALAKAHEVLAFHVEGMTSRGLPVPSPSSLDTLRTNSEFAEDFAEAKAVALIAYEGASKAVRINISIEESLLDAIDRAARESGATRSGFIADATRERLGLR